MRYLVLVVAIAALLVSAHSYFMAVRLTRDPDAAERIATWGDAASKGAFDETTMKYRTRMRWGSVVGIAMLVFWEYLGLK